MQSVLRGALSCHPAHPILSTLEWAAGEPSLLPASAAALSQYVEATGTASAWLDGEIRRMGVVVSDATASARSLAKACMQCKLPSGPLGDCVRLHLAGLRAAVPWVEKARREVGVRVTTVPPASGRPVGVVQRGGGLPSFVEPHSACPGPVTLWWRADAGDRGSGGKVRFVLRCGSETMSVLVGPGEALELSEEARFTWAVGLAAVTSDEDLEVDHPRPESMTVFLHAHSPPGPCACGWPELCDARALDTPLCEREGVHAFYDRVAEAFSGSRYKPWPRVAGFTATLPAGSLVGDLGCGNGKNMLHLPKGVVAVGTDYCQGLLDAAAGHGLDVFRADALRLPVRDGCFDAVLCIAVLHHISTPERRDMLAREIVRVAKPGAPILVYAWAKEQRQGATGARDFQSQEEVVPFSIVKTKEIHNRYCHLFVEGELEALFAGKGVRVVESAYDDNNWTVVLQKEQPSGEGMKLIDRSIDRS